MHLDDFRAAHDAMRISQQCVASCVLPPIDTQNLDPYIAGLDSQFQFVNTSNHQVVEDSNSRIVKLRRLHPFTASASQWPTFRYCEQRYEGLKLIYNYL